MEPNETEHPLTKDPKSNGNTKSSSHIVISARTGKPKRRKALRACTNCQRTHLTCDNNRPCERCVKRGCADTCVDGVRKAPKSVRQPRPFKKTLSSSSITAHAFDQAQQPSHNSNHLLHGDHPSQSLQEYHEQKHYIQEPARTQAKNHNQETTEFSYAYPGTNMRFENEYPGGAYYYEDRQMMPNETENTVRGSYKYDFYHNENEKSEMTKISNRIPSMDEPPSRHLENSIPDDEATAYTLDEYQRPHQASYSDTRHYGILSDSSGYIQMTDKSYQHTVRQTSHSSLPDLIQPLGHVANSQALFRYNDESVKEPSEDEQSIISSMLHDSRKSSLASAKLSDTSKGYLVDPSNSEYPSSKNIPLNPSCLVDEMYGPNGIISSTDINESEPDWLEIQLNPFTSIHDEKSGRFNVDSIPSLEDSAGQDAIRPFPYLESLRAHYSILRNRLSPQEMETAKEIVTRLMSIGLRITRIMSADDQIFVEQCFQRSVQEKQKQFPHAPTACMIWRRTGDIVAVSPSFCRLTGWSAQQLVTLFVTSLMDTEGIINYLKCLEMIYTSQNHNFRFMCQLGTAERKSVSTEVEISVQKDLYNLPLIIYGKFWTY